MKWISAHASLEIGAVFACIDVISGDIATTPCRLVEKKDYGSEPVLSHRMSGLLAQPNHVDTAFEFMRKVTISTSFHREAIMPFVGRPGFVKEIFSVPPPSVVMRCSREVGPVYDLMTASEFDEWYLRELPFSLLEMDLAHARHFPGANGRGLASLKTGQKILQVRAAQDQYLTELYAQRGFRPGMFKYSLKELKPGQYEKRLSSDQFKKVQDDLRDAYQLLVTQGLPMLLEDVDFEPTTMTAAENGISANRSAAETDVFRTFRVPPHKTMSFEGAKYENLGPLERMYVSDTLEPHFQCIEQALTRALLSPADRSRGLCYEFDRELAHTTDPDARQKLIDARLDRGLLNLDEGREALNMAPLGAGNGGEIRRVAGNSAVIEDGAVNYPGKSDDPAQTNETQTESIQDA